MRQISSILCMLFIGTCVLLPVCAAPGAEDLTSKAKTTSANAGGDKRSASTAEKPGDSSKNDVSKSKSATQAVKNGVASTKSVTTKVSASAVANVNAKAANTSQAVDGKSGKSADANLASTSAKKPAKTVDAGGTAVGISPVSTIEMAPVKSVGAAPVKTVGATPIKSVEASPVAASGTAPAKSVGITHGNIKDAKAITNSKETATKAVSAASSKSGAIEAKADKNAKPNKIEHKSLVKGEKSLPPAMLVPPPPPSVPTMGEMGMPMGGTTMIFMGENIDYMSAADLKDLNDKTERELQRKRRDAEDLVSSTTEKKQRASSFDQLFAEGVISRKELETAKHDNERATQDLSDAKQNLALLEQKHVRIEQRLAFLSKSKSNKQTGSRKKTSKAR